MPYCMGIEMKVLRILAAMQSKIRSYPMLFGMLIGLTILLSVIVIVNWFPGVGDAWQRNNGDVRSVWFTVGLYVVWIHRLWRWQHRNKVLFWASLGIIF